MDDQQKKFFTIVIAASFLVSAGAGFLAGELGSNILSGNRDSGGNLKETQISVVTQQDQVIKVVKETSPAVVSIIVSKDLPAIQRYQANPFGDFFNNFFGPFGFSVPQEQETEKREVGGGTGFIVSSDGLILTNKLVVSDEQAEYTVLTNDGQEYPARVLARDPAQDIAIIKVEKTGLPTLKLGDSDKIETGQTVIAIGNALGEFRNTVSVGVVSGLRRSVSASSGIGQSVEQLENVIQTDAAINSGNSGGPLLNLNGEVVGISTAVAQGAQSIGFALPVNKAKRDIDQVQKSGKISYPFLGVRYVMVTDDVKKENNLATDYGALITRGSGYNEAAVSAGGPAEIAGIKEGDIILEVNGQKINQTNSLSQAISDYNVGDTITLKILSGGQEKEVKVLLGERK